MSTIFSFPRMMTIAVFFLVMLMVLPASGMAVRVSTTAASNKMATITPSVPGTGAVTTATETSPLPTATATITAVPTEAKPFISANITPANPSVGDVITVSGVASGGNLTSGVQIWIFAGNYINVTTVPVNAQGKFSRTYPTAGLPPATYYLFVQSPGMNGMEDIVATNVNGYASQVMNINTGTAVFNFTGTGSVQDNAAALALSSAFNQPGVDDVFTKLIFNLAAPTPAGTAAPASEVTTAAPVQTTTKSPLSSLTLLAGIGCAGLLFCALKRK